MIKSSNIMDSHQKIRGSNSWRYGYPANPGYLSKFILLPKNKIDDIAKIAYQKRHVKLYDLLLKDYEAAVKVSDDELIAFYTDNPSSFIRPDQVKIDFVSILSPILCLILT